MKLRFCVLISILVPVVLAGCGGMSPFSPADVPTSPPEPSSSLDTSHANALDVNSQLALGMLLLEETKSALSTEQAAALLPLWQASQGDALANEMETEAVLRQIERTLTAEQVAEIISMQLTVEDLQAWAQSQGLGLRPAAGTGPRGSNQGGQGQFGNLSEEERAALRATAQAGGMGSFGPGAGLSEKDRAARRAAAEASGLSFDPAQDRPFPGRGASGSAAQSPVLVEQVIELLAERAGIELAQAPAPEAVEPTPTDTETPVPTAMPTPELPPTLAELIASPTPTITEPPPTPTSEPTATPAPKPASSKPKPTPTPEFTGKLVFQTSYGGDFYTITLKGTGNADGTDLQRITDGIDPVWSPDGTQIAFVRWQEPRGVWVVDADGSDERRIFDWSETRRPSWSPDGGQIIFTRQHGTVPQGPSPQRPGGPPTTGSTEAMTGPVLQRGRGGANAPGSPTWNLGVVNPYDGTFWEPEPDSEVNLAPDWSPNGEQIVYDAVRGLRIMSVDGKTSYALTENNHDAGPVWSPAPLEGGTGGSRVAFMRRQHDHWEIYVIDADGSNVRRLTHTPLQPNDQPASSVSPAWSPNGDYIAFFTNRTGKWEIWVTKSDGSDPKPMFDTELDGLALNYAHVAERAISWTR